MLKSKIVRNNAYMRLSKATGFCTEPQKEVLLLYFDSFSPPKVKRSKINKFLKVSLVSFKFSLDSALCFIFFEKMTVISLCWYTMKKLYLCKCFCAFNSFSNKNVCNLFCGINCPPLKQQGYNGFPHILFNFFSNEPQAVYYNGWLQKVL